MLLPFRSPIASSCTDHAKSWTIRTSNTGRGQNLFFSSKTSRPSLRPTLPPVQGIPGSILPAVRRPTCEVSHLPPNSALVKHEWSFISTASIRHQNSNKNNSKLRKELGRKLNSGNACYNSISNLLPARFVCVKLSTEITELHCISFFVKLFLLLQGKCIDWRSLKISGSEREKEIGVWTMGSQHKEIHSFYTLQSIIRPTRSRIIR